MKKLFLIIGLILSVLTNAQEVNKQFTADTVFGNETVYFTYAGRSLVFSNNLTGFFYKTTAIAGTLDNIILQGTNNDTNYVTISTSAAPAAGTYWTIDKIDNSVTLTTTTITNAYTSAIASSTDTCGGVADTATFTAADTATSTTTSTLTESSYTPITSYFKYRIGFDGGGGDTIVVSPIYFISKSKEE